MYEQVQEGLADRIVGMAERSLDAQAASELIPRRAEAYALLVAAIGYTALPFVFVTFAFVLVLTGHDGPALLAFLASAVTGGAQVIKAIRSRG